MFHERIGATAEKIVENAWVFARAVSDVPAGPPERDLSRTPEDIPAETLQQRPPLRLKITRLRVPEARWRIYFFVLYKTPDIPPWAADMLHIYQI